MDNKHPKSEAPALKEAAAAAKDKHGLQQSIEKERVRGVSEQASAALTRTRSPHRLSSPCQRFSMVHVLFV